MQKNKNKKIRSEIFLAQQIVIFVVPLPETFIQRHVRHGNFFLVLKLMVVMFGKHNQSIKAYFVHKHENTKCLLTTLFNVLIVAYFAS